MQSLCLRQCRLYGVMGPDIRSSRDYSAAALDGELRITNSTITRNTATQQGGGISNSYQLELKGVIVSGNTAPQAREVFTHRAQDVTAGNFKIFGFSGDAGIVGFTPSATDIVATQPVGAILKPPPCQQ